MRSGFAGSFVLSTTTNSWGPPMPGVIVKESESLVDFPGPSVV